MTRVAVLSDVLINKIAAGEVVERPASVIKELVENALDAGARQVRIALSGGGLRLVSIVDDGQGMSREDAVLAMTRHATSKLRDLDGLSTIATMGFRGEALPAIASVSRFTVVTSEPHADVGTRIEVSGGGALQLEDAPPVGGTRMRVEDLFFNTPARRKFMKSEQTELRHCEEAVLRIALARPDVAFHLEHDGKPLFTSAANDDLRERIAAALGSEVHRALLPVEERRLGVAVTGYIARPDYTLSNARGMYTFVNRRYVRDRALNASIQRAFADVLPGGRQPVVVLFIELDPREVDVNVHPQKLEVRFQDVRGVSDAVFAAIARALKADDAAAAAAGAATTGQDAAHYALAVERFLARAQTGGTGLGLEGTTPMRAFDSPFTPSTPAQAPAFGQARPGINEAPPPGFFAQLRFIGTLARRFWICEAAGGTLLVLDPHAALERARLSAYLGMAEGAQGTGQGGLFSATVELSGPEAKLVAARARALAPLGLDVEPFGGTHFAVRAVPPGLEQVDLRALLTELAPQLPDLEGPLDATTLGPSARVLACFAAGASAPAGSSSRELSSDERNALFAELDRADFHPSCRHGRIVVTELPLLELERRARSLVPEDA
ncbi:MAG: DNA mismatch repair endonuclease MutL [Myxococcaceae bacterium]